jgi:hypothetical protein
MHLLIEGDIGKDVYAVTFVRAPTQCHHCGSHTPYLQRLLYNKTYLLSSDVPVKVVFLELYKMSQVIAVPFKTFLAVHCLKLSKGVCQFC